MTFHNREEAGRRLARRIVEIGLESPVVLALPRGGVPVAAEVAAALGIGFDVFVARKLGLPGHEELGVGAIAEGLSDPVVSDLAEEIGLSSCDLSRLADSAQMELERRVRLYRGSRALPELAGRDVLLVDDGLATGVTAQAALMALRDRHPRYLVLAVPVCARETAERLESLADEVICAEAPTEFFAVGLCYEDFTQTTDAEVLDLLNQSAASRKR